MDKSGSSSHAVVDCPYSRTPLSVDTMFETSCLDRSGSGRWSTSAEFPSRDKSSSRCSQNTVTSPTCTSSSSRSETFEDLCEKQFRQSSAVSPAAGFRGSLKSRLLQRAGIFSADSPENGRDSMELRDGGSQPVGSYGNSLPENSPSVQSDGMNVNRTAQYSEDLTKSQAATTQHGGSLSSYTAQSSQYLAESQTSRAASSPFPYLPSTIVPPVANQTVHPAPLYRPGLGYPEAAATAALFYNQLAAVHHLQQQQQRLFLGARNQLTSESHAHPPLQSERVDRFAPTTPN